MYNALEQGTPVKRAAKKSYLESVSDKVGGGSLHETGKSEHKRWYRHKPSHMIAELQ